MTSGTRVVVTGAAGFIGSHLVRLLVAHGCLVTAVVRPASRSARLADVADRLMFTEGDLEDTRFCRELMETLAPEVVFHLGWYSEPGRWPDSPRHLDSLTGSLALLRAVGSSGCRRVVVGGTSVEYDTELGRVTEASPLRPPNLYGACKASLFLASERLARDQGWGFAQARIFNVYGPGEDERRLVPHVVRSLLQGEPCDLTSGKQVRDYLHVEDVASALLAIAASDVEGAVNVASSRPVSVAALARAIAELLGRPELLRLGSRPDRIGDYKCLYADINILMGRIGWRQRYDLEAGLRQTIGWWNHVSKHPADNAPRWSAP
jgi:nucleoside-diphosphate-sugar epimerase